MAEGGNEVAVYMIKYREDSALEWLRRICRLAWQSGDINEDGRITVITCINTAEV